MHGKGTRGGSFEFYRPAKGVGPGRGFPVYDCLADALVAAGPSHDATAAHVCSVLSGWAYSDAKTVAMMMVRLGLENNRCRYIELTNGAMLVSASAFLIQSECGRVAFLAYRGTEPMNLVDWLVDIDVNPVMVRAGDSSNGPGATRSASRTDARLHGGFYRNQRATWFDVMKGLQLALDGKSILDGVDEEPAASSATDGEKSAPTPKPIQPLEALYVTGHSLGGAMAAIAAFRIVNDSAYAHVASKLRGIYTFGQPMIGNPAFAARCETFAVLKDRLYRHVYENDVVARIPPTVAGEFKHFGREYRSTKPEDPNDPRDLVWRRSKESVPQLTHTFGLLPAFAEVGIEQLPALRWIPSVVRHMPLLKNSGLGYSIYDHLPTYYVQCSQPADLLTEFGDL